MSGLGIECPYNRSVLELGIFNDRVLYVEMITYVT